MKKKLRIALVFGLILGMLGTIPFKTFANADNMQKDMVETVTTDVRLKTLSAALIAAGIVDDLKKADNFTLFAPTDEAFAKIPKDKLEELLKCDKKEALIDILSYHTAPGKVTAKDVVSFDGKGIKMGNGKKAQIKVVDKDVFIDNSKIIVTDIMTKNGVIHIIDTVMMP